MLTAVMLSGLGFIVVLRSHAGCLYAECRYPVCRGICCHDEIRYAECIYAECRYGECCGSIKIALLAT